MEMVTETETETEMATATGMGMGMGREMGTETATETVMATSRAGVLLAATILLAACATVDSESAVAGACSTLVRYSAEFRERAAGEVQRLAEDSAIVEMLSDYAAMREQARACLRRESVD